MFSFLLAAMAVARRVFKAPCHSVPTSVATDFRAHFVAARCAARASAALALFGAAVITVAHVVIPLSNQPRSHPIPSNPAPSRPVRPSKLAGLAVTGGRNMVRKWPMAGRNRVSIWLAALTIPAFGAALRAVVERPIRHHRRRLCPIGSPSLRCPLECGRDRRFGLGVALKARAHSDPDVVSPPPLPLPPPKGGLAVWQ